MRKSFFFSVLFILLVLLLTPRSLDTLLNAVAVGFVTTVAIVGIIDRGESSNQLIPVQTQGIIDSFSAS